MQAVILAAGLGSRLGHRLPKGLLELEGESLVQRSLRLLGQSGLPVTLVVGHQAEFYGSLPERPRLVENPNFATTGSLRSLILAHQALQDDLLVLESDLLYEPRALESILRSPDRDVILTSGLTGSGDEVWVDAPAGRLRGLSKDAALLEGDVCGEFVGISKFSRNLLDQLQTWGASFPEAHYETDGLVSQCAVYPIKTLHIADLIWCEVDDPQHWQRCQQWIWPRLRALL